MLFPEMFLAFVFDFRAFFLPWKFYSEPCKHYWSGCSPCSHCLFFRNPLKICPVFPDKPIFTMPTKKRTQKPNHLKEPILYDHFGNPLDQVDPTPPNSRLTILTTILTILTSISILTSTINPPPWPPGSEKGQGTGGEEEIRGCRGRHLGQGGRGGAARQEVACPPLQRLSQDQLSKHKSAACWG